MNFYIKIFLTIFALITQEKILAQENRLEQSEESECILPLPICTAEKELKVEDDKLNQMYKRVVKKLRKMDLMTIWYQKKK